MVPNRPEYCKYFFNLLNHLVSLISFYTPWKHQKTPDEIGQKEQEKRKIDRWLIKTNDISNFAPNPHTTKLKKKKNKEKISKFFHTTLQYLKKFSEDFVF